MKDEGLTGTQMWMVIKSQRIRRTLLFLLLLVCAQLQAQPQSVRRGHAVSSSDLNRLRRLERQFEQLRTILRIPGMSAAIVKDQRLLWTKGFGYADIEKRIPATPKTLYYIASLTKTFASTVLMQLVEQGKLDLNEPMSSYSSEFKDDSVRIKHILTHTSGGIPGEKFRYDGARFALLTAVIEKKTGKSFREVLAEMFLDPLNMSDSIPSRDVFTVARGDSIPFGERKVERYQVALARYAQPYRLYGNEVIHTTYPWEGVSAAAGLLSTAPDLAKFDIAIDRHVYLKKETQDEAWSPFVSNNGQPLLHGLGWFVQNYHGLRCVWHFGNDPNEFSGTYVKLPDNGLSLIILANSDALSTTFLRSGILTTSPFVTTFLRIFAFEDRAGHLLPDPNWAADPENFATQIARMKSLTPNYSYDAEEKGYTAIARWLERSRKSAFTAIKIDPETFGPYVGQYRFADGTNFTVTKQGDHLMIRQQQESDIELFSESSTRFFTKAVDAEIAFIKDRDGNVIQMNIYQDGQMLVANKIK